MPEESQQVLRYLPERAEYAELCDITLTAEGQNIPAHGAVIALHSGFFCNMLADLRSGDCKHESLGADGKLCIKLDDHVSAEDTRLMLAIMYGQILQLKSAQEAWAMVHLGDKYDADILFRISEHKMCELGDSLYFMKPSKTTALSSTKENVEDGTEKWLDAAMWLGLADRLGMEDLRTKCQCIILQDIVANSKGDPVKPELLLAMASLNNHGASPKSICDIFGAYVR
ncbi:unnamed protein product, partial [Ostreobium quekettii]|eukprot:evm.model.scf_1196.3 EVM.evm.TU.scf_1196.3   scf_1196:37273-38350(+)